ncbi:MAG TPA: NDP-sugar synthase [Candidatus Polarisedimenticolaceae bacterium]|nr:NDP-sugar synthase [Candidatus Polarisedimenticolaceae bacterium]
MLLSAGLGRRMMPLTLRVPKPAIPVLGRPMAIETLARMARFGVDEVVINLHHLPEAVRRMCSEGLSSAIPEVRFSMEEQILGTAGGLRRAAPLLRGAGPILLHNCDFLSDIDFAAALAAHRHSGRAATLVVVPARPGYGTVEIDRAGRVVSLAGRPAVDPERVAERMLFTGCHLIEEQVLDMIPDDRPSGIVEQVYRPLAARGALGGYLHPGFWWEFGTPELYLEGSLRLLDLPSVRRIEIASHDPVDEIGSARVAVGAGATLDDGLRLEGRVAVGMASHVAEGTRLADSVVMRESWIGPGSRLERVIVGPGVELPAGYRGGRSLICSADRLPPESIPVDLRREGDLVVYDFAADRVAGR